MMIACHVTVIGDKENECVLQQPSLLQCRPNPANLFVNKGNGAVIAASRTADLVEAQIALPKRRRMLCVALRVTLSPVANVRRGHVILAISLHESLRRIVRAMGSGERNLQEERRWF